MQIKTRMLIALLVFCTAGTYAPVKGKQSFDTKVVCAGASIDQMRVSMIQKESWRSNIPSTVEAKELTDGREEDIELIALVTMAEAEGESEYGKRLVIDTVLNRMDSEHYPDTAYEVIYQPAQFSSMWNGRVDRCYVMYDICRLVEEELQERTNYEVMFFTAGSYGKYGTPMFREGNHYFSSYE